MSENLLTRSHPKPTEQSELFVEMYGIFCPLAHGTEHAFVIRMQTASIQSTSPRAIKILAKSIFRELKSSGYNRHEVLAFATEMLGLVRTDLHGDDNVVAEAE